jgi:precorrin-6Y C5,15-methyltransferase (decarboxylating)
VIGGRRQLDLVREQIAARPMPLPKPLAAGLPPLLRAFAGRRVCVLASGDPMFHGIGSTLVRLLGPEAVQVVPAVSSVSLACARLRWPVEDVTVVSTVGRPWEAIHAAMQPGRRLLVLVAESTSAGRLAKTLRDRGFGPSAMVLLTRLGAADETAITATADDWLPRAHDRLALLAVECRPAPGAQSWPAVPGLPDSAYCSDGQLTKREVRAVTLSALRPVRGQVLWDVGAGTGTVGIEWMRTDPSCRAVAIEPRADRCERIVVNAKALGVPALEVVAGRAPDALDGLAKPDAVFVGGGVSVPGVLDRCLDELDDGGRLVVNAVTVESESLLAAHHARLGGELIRLAVHRAAPLGEGFGWRPAMPVTQWTYVKELP